jgi:hypothetical protein
LARAVLPEVRSCPDIFTSITKKVLRKNKELAEGGIFNKNDDFL